MNNFKIIPEMSWYTNPTSNTRTRGRFIFSIIDAFCHSDYHSGDANLRDTLGTTENIICTLKNQFNDTNSAVLLQAEKKLVEILKNDLPEILKKTGKDHLIICTIPRAKALQNYSKNQLGFKSAVSTAVKGLNGFSDGVNYIIRHTDTRTTHMDRSGYGGNGNLPFPGITNQTCTITDDIKGKDILLIDDLYTKSVNIDEDAIQALLDNGANSVVFYSIGKTV